MHAKTAIRVENEVSGEIRRFATLTEATRFHIQILGEPSSTNPANKNRRTKAACKNNTVVSDWKFFLDDTSTGAGATTLTERAVASSVDILPEGDQLSDPVQSNASSVDIRPDADRLSDPVQSNAPTVDIRPTFSASHVSANASSGKPDFFTFTDEVDAMFAGKKLRVCEIDGTNFVSAYDIICLISDKPRQEHRIYSDIMTTFPEMKTSTMMFQFPGERQRPTPVVSLNVYIQIVLTLQGTSASRFRLKACSVLERFLRGDATLIPELANNASSSAPFKTAFTTPNKLFRFHRPTAPRHENARLSDFDGRCVYVLRIRLEGEELLKVGKTEDLVSRLMSHEKNFDVAEVYSVTPCNNHSKLEGMVKDRLRPYNVVHKTFKELYHGIDAEDVDDIVQACCRCVNMMDERDWELRKEEQEIRKMELEIKLNEQRIRILELQCPT